LPHCFFRDELAEVGGKAGEHCAAEVGKSCFHVGSGEACIDLLCSLSPTR
jgi:hypothetical protein